MKTKGVIPEHPSSLVDKIVLHLISSYIPDNCEYLLSSELQTH